MALADCIIFQGGFMKYFILISLLLLVGCTSDLRQSYSYLPDKAIFVKELGLDLKSSDFEIQNAVKVYFERFGQNLTFTYQNGKLNVKGHEKAIKTFEYIFFNNV